MATKQTDPTDIRYECSNCGWVGTSYIKGPAWCEDIFPGCQMCDHPVQPLIPLDTRIDIDKAHALEDLAGLASVLRSRVNSGTRGKVQTNYWKGFTSPDGYSVRPVIDVPAELAVNILISAGLDCVRLAETAMYVGGVQ